MATEKKVITRYEGGQYSRVEDLLAVESRINVSVNGGPVLSLYCSPVMVRELVVGLLMTEGIAEGICTERMSIVYGEAAIDVDVHAEGEVRREGGAVTSGCVGGVTYEKPLSSATASDPVRIEAGALMNVFKRFQKRSDMYNETGCIHSAALADADDMLAFAEDIGRHNAVDKVIGYSLIEGLAFGGRMMLASGRLSSEIVSKCAKWGIPVVVSRAAPTALAVRIAEENGLTVVGFARGARFNVYTRPDRIA